MEYVRRGVQVAASRCTPSQVLRDRRQRAAAEAAQDELRRLGCTIGEIEWGGSNHIKQRFVTASGNAGIVTMASSPSDCNAVKAVVQTVRRVVRACDARGQR